MLRVPSSRDAVEVAKLAPVPHLDRAALAAGFLADAHALGVEAVSPERRGAAGADPFRSALVTPFLLGEPLLQRLHDLVPRAERFDLGHLLGRQVKLGDAPQPFLGDLGSKIFAAGDRAAEHLAEYPVEAVDLALVVNEGGARQIIELLGLGGDDVGIERFEQQQMLLQRSGNARLPQRLDETDEHGRRPVTPNRGFGQSRSRG